MQGARGIRAGNVVPCPLFPCQCLETEDEAINLPFTLQRPVDVSLTKPGLHVQETLPSTISHLPFLQDSAVQDPSTTAVNITSNVKWSFLGESKSENGVQITTISFDPTPTPMR